MAMTMHVDIVSAEKEIFSGRAEMLSASAADGEVGILPQHSQMITPLRAGQIRLKISDTEEKVFYVSSGMLEVQPDVVTVLADTAERAEDLDEAIALEAKRRAEEAMVDTANELDYAKALIEQAQAIAQIAAIRKLKK